jgi:hypothetical protein
MQYKVWDTPWTPRLRPDLFLFGTFTLACALHLGHIPLAEPRLGYHVRLRLTGRDAVC